MAGAITISVIGDVRNLVGGLDQAEGKLGKLGGATAKTAGLLKTAFVAAGAAMVGSKVISFFKDATAEARESQKVNAQTAAVLKSTGAAAGITAKQIGNLATSISNKTGIDDEAIQSGANLLLTFTNIRNEAGKGNDVFNQTTQIVTDMSAALGQDLKSSAIQMGKALNDPIKGVTALSRVGVSFTAQQKAQIKTLVESGKTLDAQKLILGEVKKEFGGSAAAIATPAQKLGVTIGNIKESIGTALIPILDKVAGYLNNKLPGWVASAGAAFNTLKGKLGPVAAVLGDFLAKLKPVGDWFRKNPAVIKGAAIALGVAAVAAGGLALAMGAVAVATSPITAIVLAVAALGGAIAYAYKNSSTFRGIVAQVGDVITGKVLPAVQQFGSFITGTVIPAVVQIAQKIGANLAPILTALAQTFQTQVLPAVQRLVGKFEEWRPTIQRVISVVVKITGKVLEFGAKIAGKVIPIAVRFAGFLAGKYIGAVTKAIGVIVRIIGAVVSFGSALVNGAKKVADFAGKVSGQIARVVKFFTGLPGKVLAAVGDLSQTLLSAGKQLIQGLIDGIGDMFGAVQSKLGSLTNKLTSWKGPPKRDKVILRPAGRLIIQGLIDGIRDGESSLKDYLGKVTNLVVKTFNKTHKTDLKPAQVRQLNREIQKVGRTLSGIVRQYAAWKDLAKSTTDEARQFASITTVADFGVGATSGSAGIIAGLTSRLDAVRRFNKDLKALAKAGLNKTTLQQILAAGVEAGTPYAEALLAGVADIKRVNQLQAQINTATSSLGQSAATAVTGLDPAQVKTAATKAANQIRNIIRRHTGITIDVTTSSSTRQRARVNADAITTRTSSKTAPANVTVKLTAQQVSQLERGREIALDLRAYQKAGGR